MMLLSLLFATTLAHAAQYSCTTEFGETVPIRKIVLKTGKTCDGCKDAGATVPEDLLDPDNTREWNSQMEKDTAQPSKVKRHVLTTEDRLVLLDTRYARQNGPTFRFQMKCSKGKKKCEGSLPDADASGKLKIYSPRLFDHRPEARTGYLELMLATREQLGFIARIFKEDVPLDKGEKQMVSASGEIKFFQEDPLFSMDAGADEQMHLIGDLFQRIAALEIKITCKKK